MRGMRMVVTYNCNIMCSCCSYKCSPLKRGMMDLKDFYQEVTDAGEEGYGDYIIIEGGELFLHTGMLFKYLKKISKLCMKKYIVTNGFWGNCDPYLDILRDLKKWGAGGVILEYDYFHSVFIEKNVIKEAIKKCQVNGIPVRLKAFFTSGDISSREDKITYGLVKEFISEFKGLEVIFEEVIKKDEYVMPSRRKSCEKAILFS